MSKKPNNTPAIGDTVRLKGRLAKGTLKRTNERLWAVIEWIEGTGPALCHLYELEKINDENNREAG